MAKQVENVQPPEEEIDNIDLPVTEDEAAAAVDDGPHAEWFVIHSYSGMENKVKKNIEHRAESMGMTDRILEVVVPT